MDTMISREGRSFCGFPAKVELGVTLGKWFVTNYTDTGHGWQSLGTMGYDSLAQATEEFWDQVFMYQDYQRKFQSNK